MPHKGCAERSQKKVEVVEIDPFLGPLPLRLHLPAWARSSSEDAAKKRQQKALSPAAAAAARVCALNLKDHGK